MEENFRRKPTAVRGSLLGFVEQLLFPTLVVVTSA